MLLYSHFLSISHSFFGCTQFCRQYLNYTIFHNPVQIGPIFMFWLFLRLSLLQKKNEYSSCGDWMRDIFTTLKEPFFHSWTSLLSLIVGLWIWSQRISIRTCHFLLFCRWQSSAASPRMPRMNLITPWLITGARLSRGISGWWARRSSRTWLLLGGSEWGNL